MSRASFRAIPSLFAHRGCSRNAPENTLAAFRLAAEREIPGIELDVQFAASGEVVVIHDDSLARLAGVDAPVAAIEWAELRTVDVGGWFGEEYRSERIPLLDEVLETFGTGMFFDIELKTKLRRNDRLPYAVADIINRHNLCDGCIVSSFNPFAVGAIAAVNRGAAKPIATAAIYANDDGVPRLLRHGAGVLLGRCGIAKPQWNQAGRLPTLRHHLFGRRVAAWTVNERETAKRLFEAGVDAVISDVPEALLDLI